MWQWAGLPLVRLDRCQLKGTIALSCSVKHVTVKCQIRKYGLLAIRVHFGVPIFSPVLICCIPAAQLLPQQPEQHRRWIGAVQTPKCEKNPPNPAKEGWAHLRIKRYMLQATTHQLQWKSIKIADKTLPLFLSVSFRLSVHRLFHFLNTIENSCYPESKYVPTIQTGKFNFG